MSKAKEWADKLNGRQYRKEIIGDEHRQAKADRVLIVYGASDDLTEFEGIIYDECDAYDSATHYLRYSQADGWEIGGQNGEKFKKSDYPIKIEAKWCPKDAETSWRITSNIPFEPFTIREDEETYCIGCVINERDMIEAFNQP